MGVAAVLETSQYLTFRLGEENYAVDVANIREILDYTTVTKVPQSPDFIRGMGKRNAQFIMILDIDKVFSCDDARLLSGQAGL